MTRKNFYMDRALRHRDPRFARILSALGYSTRHMESAPSAVVQEPADDLSDLRAQYQEIIGKRPFHGWDAEELQRRIDEALAS